MHRYTAFMRFYSSPVSELSKIRRFDNRVLEGISSNLSSSTRKVLPENDRGRACVLVPLCHVNEIPSVLFTVRTLTVGTHRGQVSFPGGHVDPSDTSLTHTAVRETCEELGLTVNRIIPLGLCGDLPAITRTIVTPVVAYIGNFTAHELLMLTVSVREIASVFALSLEQLQERQMEHIPTRGPMPVFTAGPQKVWGLTAVILARFITETLLPVARSL